MEKMKTTAPVSSVGADGVQPNVKNHNEIIANSQEQINQQATKNPEKSGNDGLHTMSMPELYDTVFVPRVPIVDGFLYGGTYLFVGAPKVGKSFFMGNLRLLQHRRNGKKPDRNIWIDVECWTVSAGSVS